VNEIGDAIAQMALDPSVRRTMGFLELSNPG